MKSAEERGAFAYWAVETRHYLELSSEKVAAETGYDDSTIRKFEGGTVRVSRPLRRRVTDYLQRVAKEKGVRIPPPPGEPIVEGSTPASDPEGLAEAIRELVAEVRLGRLAQERTEDRLSQLLAAVLHVAVGEEAWSRIETVLADPVGEGTR